MSICVRETLCTGCSHRDVCKYKDEYLDLIKELSDKYNYSNTGSKFVFNDPSCRYFLRKQEVTIN